MKKKILSILIVLSLFVPSMVFADNNSKKGNNPKKDDSSQRKYISDEYDNFGDETKKILSSFVAIAIMTEEEAIDDDSDALFRINSTKLRKIEGKNRDFFLYQKDASIGNIAKRLNGSIIYEQKYGLYSFELKAEINNKTYDCEFQAFKRITSSVYNKIGDIEAIIRLDNKVYKLDLENYCSLLDDAYSLIIDCLSSK